MNGDGHDTYWGERLKSELKRDLASLDEDIGVLAKKVDQLGARMRSRPTKAQVAMAILVAGGTVVGAVYRRTADTETRTEAAVASHASKHDDEVMRLRTEFQNSANRTTESVEKLTQTIIRVVARRSPGRDAAGGGAP